MASIFSHAVVAYTLGKLPSHEIFSRRTLFLGALCSVIPDLDVIGFAFGVQYGDLWGHRGITHSLFFAALLSLLICLFYRSKPAKVILTVFVYFFLCTASHGVLDAMTNGGLGVAFFSPFDTTRYFFAFRPIAVSPIGVGFFSERGVHVIWSELQWIWLPSLIVLVAARIYKQR